MKRQVLYCATALLMLGMLALLTFQSQRPTAVPTASAAAPVDPTATLSEISLRTGDSFWGLHLDGVIPCSTMLVKGGGHLVILAPVDNPQGKCHFHVKDEKVVQLQGRTFRMKVVGDDQVQVVREDARMASAEH